MSAFMIEIAQGCVKTWKKSTKSITIAELRSLVQESPQSFKGDVGGVDFRLEVGGAVLSEDYQMVKATKLFSKKRDGKKSAVSSSSTPSSNKATSSKKEKEGHEVQVDLPLTASGPSNLCLSGRGVCFLFPTTEAATEFAVQTCTEYGVDLKKAIVEQEKDKKKLRADKLRAELAELEADEEGSNHAGFTGSSSSSSEGEEIDIEDIDVDSAAVPKQKEEPVAAVAKSKSSKKGSK
jgi:hypothetical protein